MYGQYFSTDMFILAERICHQNQDSSFPHSACFFLLQCNVNHISLISMTDTDMTDHPLRYINIHDALKDESSAFSWGMWYSTCRGSSRKSAWSSFCINNCGCCCLMAGSSTNVSGYGV